ncbi:MAG: tRNA (adenosine(37)-N6)-dimethylallyltransferase MiaA [Spirochaetia bacterium]|nr:tRNA (adenosine(37)-N6)-dimethylallyltransferase MiaA [Spirochaetia bacterium]
MLNIQSSIRNKYPLIFLFGPTGVGKTALLENFFHDNYSIINADSIQIFRHLNIGSAKPDEAMLSRIPHYLVNIREPHESFSVGDFVHLSDDALVDIRAHNRIPIVCGGTAYYFKHFYYGLPVSPKSSTEVRLLIARKVEEKSLAWAYEELQRIDPLSATKIHPSDSYRVTRALEVYETSGKPLSSYQVPSVPRTGLHPLIIGLHRDKKELHERIEERVDMMFKAGLMDEIEALLQMGATASWPGMQGIGYREYFTLKENNSFSIPLMRDMIISNSQKYAKRQMTFFRSIEGVNWVHPDDTSRIEELLNTYYFV